MKEGREKRNKMGSIASVCEAVSYSVKRQRSTREMVSAFSSFNLIAQRKAVLQPGAKVLKHNY